MALILALSDSQEFLGKVEAAAGPDHTVETLPKKFHRYVRERAASVVVLDLSAELFTGEDLSELVWLKRNHPATGIVVVLKERMSLTFLHQLGRLEIDHLVYAWASSDVAELAECMRQALKYGPAHRVEVALSDDLSWWERKAIAKAVSNVHQHWNADRYAWAFRSHRKRLGRDFRERRLPTLRSTLVWARILFALHFLIEPGRSFRSLAGPVGYQHAHHLIRAFRRIAGRCAKEISEKGDLESLVAMMLDQRPRFHGPSPQEGRA